MSGAKQYLYAAPLPTSPAQESTLNSRLKYPSTHSAAPLEISREHPTLKYVKSGLFTFPSKLAPPASQEIVAPFFQVFRVKSWESSLLLLFLSDSRSSPSLNLVNLSCKIHLDCDDFSSLSLPWSEPHQLQSRFV